MNTYIHGLNEAISVSIPSKIESAWKSLFSSGMPPMKLVIIDTFHLQRVIIPAEVIPDMFVVITHYRRRPVDVEIMEKY